MRNVGILSNRFLSRTNPEYIRATWASEIGADIKTIDGVLYVIHAYTSVSSHTFTPPTGVSEVDVLVVAGGGGGGSGGAAGRGGGGAGGLVLKLGHSIGSSVSLVVGGGGNAQQNGANSSFDDLIALGGGHGNPNYEDDGEDGGSGGGGGTNASGGTGLQPTSNVNDPPIGYGNNGGGGATHAGGGGGGAGDLGESATNAQENMGDGGDGMDMSPYFTNAYGENGWFAGGGAGGGRDPATNNPGIGGQGGGGNGGYIGTSVQSGMSNTGGGGGGNISTGGSGGSGIVLVRYPLSEVTNELEIPQEAPLHLKSPEINKLMMQMVDMKYQLSVPDSGWQSSARGDYLFYLDNWAAANGISSDTEIEKYQTSGTYTFIGGGSFSGSANAHLYIEVPSDVGVTANNAASFMSYLSSNPITINWCIADNLKLWVHSGLVETRVSGDDTFVPKAYDISGEENDATQTTEANQPELVSDGMELDGNEYMILGTDPSIDLKPDEAWTVLLYEYTAEGDVGYFIAKGDGPVITLEHQISILRNPEIRITVGGTRYDYDEDLLNDQWNHLALVNFNDNGTWKYSFYVDGSLKTTEESGTVTRPDTDFLIGARRTTPPNSGAGFLFNGRLNDIRFYDKVLSESEITAIYNQTKGFYGIT